MGTGRAEANSVTLNLLSSLSLSPLSRSPRVTFCGYSIPHPSEAVVNMRIQTTGKNGRSEREREDQGRGPRSCPFPQPHPSHVSTPGEISAAAALRQACVDLKAACAHVSSG